MSLINSFLQKNKVQEAHHGIFMVVAAYVLSAALLLFGSDVFYGSKSKAEKISMDSYEENFSDWEEDPIPALNYKIEDPYGLTAKAADDAAVEPEVSDDTNWLMGFGMTDEEYNQVLMNLEEYTSGRTNLSGAKEAAEEVVESLSVSSVSSKNGLALTEKEIAMLERIVEAEATGEDMIGRILVANVVLNRMADEEFPDTVEEVIFQKSGDEYQFSPISDKRYWSVKVSSKTKEAVKRALEGEDYSKGALYFMSRKLAKKSSARWFDENLKWLFKHGGHEFYK